MILHMARYFEDGRVNICRVKQQQRIIDIMLARGYVEISKETYEQELAVKRAKLGVGE